MSNTKRFTCTPNVSTAGPQQQGPPATSQQPAGKAFKFEEKNGDLTAEEKIWAESAEGKTVWDALTKEQQNIAKTGIKNLPPTFTVKLQNGGKRKSNRNKSNRNKSKRNKSKRNKSNRNKSNRNKSKRNKTKRRRQR